MSVGIDLFNFHKILEALLRSAGIDTLTDKLRKIESLEGIGVNFMERLFSSFNGN